MSLAWHGRFQFFAETRLIRVSRCSQRGVAVLFAGIILANGLACDSQTSSPRCEAGCSPSQEQPDGTSDQGTIVAPDAASDQVTGVPPDTAYDQGIPKEEAYDAFDYNPCQPSSTGEWEEKTGSLSAWQDARSFDKNSVVANPGFLSVAEPYDLSAASKASPLVNKGDPKESAPTSIAGTARDSEPDIGAYEFK
jgi:hypothetical protein